MSYDLVKKIDKQGIVVKVTEELIVLMTNDGGFKNIPRNPDCFPRIGEPISYTEHREDKVNLAHNWIKYFAYAAVVVLMVFGYSTFLSKSAQETFLVAVDINPSIEIYTDSDYRVLRLIAINHEAEELIDNIDTEGKNLEVVLKDLISQSIKKGYLKNNQESLIVSSVVDLQLGKKDISKEVKNTIEHVLQKEKFSTSVVVEREEKDMVVEAHKNLVSVNKYKLYKKINSSGGKVDLKEIKKKPVKALLEQKKKLVETKVKDNKPKATIVKDSKSSVRKTQKIDKEQSRNIRNKPNQKKSSDIEAEEKEIKKSEKNEGQERRMRHKEIQEELETREKRKKIDQPIKHKDIRN